MVGHEESAFEGSPDEVCDSNSGSVDIDDVVQR